MIANSPWVIQKPETHRGNWNTVFEKTQPVYIEVGMGKGRFLMDMAKKHPDINYIGIEMYDSVLLRAVQKAEQLEEKLTNLYFIRMEARELPEVLKKVRLLESILIFPIRGPRTAMPSAV